MTFRPGQRVFVPADDQFGEIKVELPGGELAILLDDGRRVFRQPGEVRSREAHDVFSQLNQIFGEKP